MPKDKNKMKDKKKNEFAADNVTSALSKRKAQADAAFNGSEPNKNKMGGYNRGK